MGGWPSRCACDGHCAFRADRTPCILDWPVVETAREVAVAAFLFSADWLPYRSDCCSPAVHDGQRRNYRGGNTHDRRSRTVGPAAVQSEPSAPGCWRCTLGHCFLHAEIDRDGADSVD